MLTNSQHDAIMRRYSLIQADEQRALSLRREQAYAKIPRLRSLDEEAGRTALARARQLILEKNAPGSLPDEAGNALVFLPVHKQLDFIVLVVYNNTYVCQQCFNPHMTRWIDRFELQQMRQYKKYSAIFCICLNALEGELYG